MSAGRPGAAEPQGGLLAPLRSLRQGGPGYGAAGEGPSAEGEGGEGSSARLFALVLCLCCAVVAEGYDIGVLNGVAVRIQDEFGFGSLEIGVIVSVTPLFVILGSGLGGWLADHYGRQRALAATLCFLVVGPVVMSLAGGFRMLVAGRALVGTGIGAGVVVVSAYIAEIAPATLRGRFVGMEEVSLNVGMLLGYVANWGMVGMEDDWRYMLALGSLLNLVVVASLAVGYIPESPRWLMLHGRDEEALAILARFTGAREASAALGAWKADPRAGAAAPAAALWPLDPPMRRALTAGVVVGVAQTCCGYLAVAYYSSKVMSRVMGEKQAFLNTVIMGLIKTLVVIAVVFKVDDVGRRTALLASTLGTVVGCVWVAVAFQGAWSPWALAAGFWVFMAGFSLGLGPVTFVYVAEIFPTELRGKAMGVVILFSRVVATASTLAFPLATERLGVPTTFLAQAGVNVLICAALAATVRETRGLALEEVKGAFA